MAGSETDAGADAVALAIRDLTEEVRKLRRALCVVGLASLHKPDSVMDIELHRKTVDAFADLFKAE